MPEHPPLAVAQRFRAKGKFASLVPRFAASDPGLADAVRELQAAVDASVVHCTDCDREKIECDVVRNDGTDLSMLCHAEHSLTNRARTYGRDWGMTFRREGDSFRSAALTDVARSGDARQLDAALPLLELRRDTFFVLGDDQLVVAAQSGAAMDPDWAVASGSDLGEALLCDEILRTRPGAAAAPLAFSVHFDPMRPASDSIRFRALDAEKTRVASTLERDVQAWLTRPGAWMPQCRVTLSDESLVSVQCSSADAGAGFTYRLGDGSRVGVEELLAHLTGPRTRLTRDCVDARWPADPVKNVAVPVQSALTSFSLELDAVVFAVPYSAPDDANRIQLALCRVPYRDLHTTLAEIARGR